MIESCTSARSRYLTSVCYPPLQTAHRPVYRNGDLESRAVARTRRYGQRPAQAGMPLANPDEPQARPGLARPVRAGLEADAVIFDAIPDRSAVLPQPYGDVAGLRVLPHVVERLLNDSVDRRFSR